MKYETIADIYSANQKFRENFAATVRSISPDEASALADGEKWTIEQLVEHTSSVGTGVSRICAKLLDGVKKDGKVSDGSFALSTNFGERAAAVAVVKVEAPERVHPTGDVRIDESLDRLAASTEAFNSMRADMEQFDLSGHTFPHPFFGDLTAGEWLVMAGLHEARHAKQIETVLAKLRQEKNPG